MKISNLFQEKVVALLGDRQLKQLAGNLPCTYEYARQVFNDGKIPNDDIVVGLADALSGDREELLYLAALARTPERVRAKLKKLEILQAEIRRQKITRTRLNVSEESAVYNKLQAEGMLEVENGEPGENEVCLAVWPDHRKLLAYYRKGQGRSVMLWPVFPNDQAEVVEEHEVALYRVSGLRDLNSD